MSPTAVEAARFAVAALGGVALALAYFAALRRTVALLAGDRGWRGPVVLTAARVVVATGVFTAAALHGAALLLATLVGFAGGRAIALRRARRGA